MTAILIAAGLVLPLPLLVAGIAYWVDVVRRRAVSPRPRMRLVRFDVGPCPVCGAPRYSPLVVRLRRFTRVARRAGRRPSAH